MNRVDPSAIASFLAYVQELDGTDLHLSVGAPPLVRRDGVLAPVVGEPAFDAFGLEAMIASLLGPETSAQFDRQKEFDFAFDYGDDRFRGNVFRQRGTVSLALRRIPNYIPSFDELGLPDIVSDLVQLPQGLVLVTGPTGSGKSTTLASMLDWINANRRVHIITIEDPIEYMHYHKKSAINQREIGPDADDFYSGLRSALREDPDVLLVGEMRDPESIGVAMSIAETGHLVFATLHTNDTAQALDRIIDVFPADRRDQIQVQLSSTLQAVIYQRLIPRTHGGLVAAFEVLKTNHAVRNLVREGKTQQLRNVVSTSSGEGMQTLETALTGLVADGIVDYDVALGYSLYPKELHRRRLLQADMGGSLAPVEDELLEDEATPEPVGARRGLRRR